MKIKSVPIGQVKAGPDDGLQEGEFLVYPSTFTRTPDSYGDVVAKGAFLDSIAAWKESGDVLPAMYLHDPNQIIGGAVDMGEDDHGWWVKGKFDDDPAAQRIYKQVKGRRLGALSFAFDVIEEGATEIADGETANELRKLNVHEFSFLPKGFAANADTSVVAVKSFTDEIARAVKRGEAIDIDSLRSARDAIGAIVASLEHDQEKASGKPPANSDASGERPECTGQKGHSRGYCPRHLGSKSSVSDEEPKASPSVARLAAQTHIYALMG